MKKTTKRMLLASIALLICATGNLWAGTVVDIGVNPYLQTLTAAITGIGIAALILGLTWAGAKIALKHTFGDGEKIMILSLIGGGILMSIAGTAVGAIFGDNLGSGALLSSAQIAQYFQVIV